MNKNRERYLERRAKLHKNPPRKLKVKKEKSEAEMDNFNILMVCIFFLASFYILFTSHSLDLSVFQCFQMYFLFLGIGFIVSINKYRKKLQMSYYEYVLFNIMAFAPGLIALTFFLNGLYFYKTYEETYKIKSFQHTEVETIYVLKDNQYEDKEYLRTISQKDEVVITGHNFYNIKFANGFLGIRVILEKSLN